MQLEKMDAFFEARLDGYEEHMLTNIDGAEAFYPFTAQLLPDAPGAKVLDLGCGTGLELRWYYEKNPTARIAGIDLSAGMLEVLWEKYRDKKPELVCGSYFDIPLGEQVFDAAVSVESLHHFTPEEKLPLYEKLHQSLKPGGWFVLTDYFALSDAEELQHRQALLALRQAQDLDAEAFYHYDTPLTVAHERQILLQAGFARVEILKNWGATYTLKAVKTEETELRRFWKEEEELAHIHGWDFSYIEGRFWEDTDFPWGSYRQVIENYLRPEMKLLDIDTGGGEFLLSLGHPHNNTAATEGFPPNVQLCKETLLPLGIDFKECSDAANIPYPDESFDIIINRHGDFNAKELYRLLKKGGLFITQQVGSENDRELVEMVLPGTPKQFSDLNLKVQKKAFEEAGFEVLQAEEAFIPIRFFDVGAFVWFARIIEWEFPGFSVDKCFDKLLAMHKTIEENGEVAGTTHRYMIVARK